ncbi:MAG: transposase [Verrucomicrobia bacterium]|nr:MAG: transposase [Verrucomicrobiota bacterium]TAE89150.1 MAG: transposase [Verrucomicrobiota bacterium]TAF27976.1 MAG: transposase [Verrucomicrobiota bacterium]TAF42824.1 MAG: transposase [Verrucomicrobiota bacterium]
MPNLEARRLEVSARPARSSAQNSRQRHAATRLNQIWTYDFVHDQTDDGGRLKWLPIVDGYSRELLNIEVVPSITVEEVVPDLERLVWERGAPELICFDDGPESVVRAVRD